MKILILVTLILASTALNADGITRGKAMVVCSPSGFLHASFMISSTKKKFVAKLMAEKDGNYQPIPCTAKKRMKA